MFSRLPLLNQNPSFLGKFKSEAACASPPGIVEPNQADRQITDKLKQVLGLFDIRTLDHFIVGKEGAYSFAEHGLI